MDPCNKFVFSVVANIIQYIIDLSLIFVANIAKSTPGLVLVEVLHLGIASLAGLQPDVRGDLEIVWMNYSFDLC